MRKSLVVLFGITAMLVTLPAYAETNLVLDLPLERQVFQRNSEEWAEVKDAGYQMPWFVAQASFHPGSQAPEQEQVAKGQQLLWAKRICGQGPVTDDLLGAEYRHDGVHFNQKGLERHAERWFEALSQGLK